MKKSYENIPFLKTRFGIFLSFCLMLVLFFGFIGIFEKWMLTAKNIKRDTEEYETLKEEISKKQERFVDMTSQESLEKSIRENYNLVKNDEGLVVIIEQDEEQEIENKKNENLGFFGKIRNIFKRQ